MAPSRLVELIDSYKSAHGVPDAELARRIGISRQNLSLWRTTGFRALPARNTLDGVAAVVGRPYREVLEAALWDSGYAVPTDDAPRRYDEVLADAIRILTEATRLTTSRVHQTADGAWKFVDGVRDPIDWAEFVCAALAGAAANAGGIAAVLAGRPGSWEAGCVRDILHATVGDDVTELMRRRTDPVEIVVHPERILFDRDESTWFDDYDNAEAELNDREDAISPSYVYSWPGHELSDEARAYFATRNVVIVDGPPPGMYPASDDADTTPPPTDDELAEQDQIDAARDAIDTLRERLTAQQHAELAAYGQTLVQAITTRLTALQLPVAVSVTVDLDTPFGDAPETPDVGFATGLDAIVADAIADTDTPDVLPGTPLERLDAASTTDPTAPLS